MRITIPDVLFLIAFTLWISTLQFNALSQFQIISLVILGSWLLFIIFRLFGRKKD
ncbi:MAG: hypothetical protein ACOX0F_11395 [Syntrophomonadaceae bacterium]